MTPAKVGGSSFAFAVDGGGRAPGIAKGRSSVFGVESTMAAGLDGGMGKRCAGVIALEPWLSWHYLLSCRTPNTPFLACCLLSPGED